MKTTKNKSVNFLDSKPAAIREALLKKAVRLGRIQRDNKRKSAKDLCMTIIARHKEKKQKRDQQARKTLGTSLKKGLDALFQQATKSVTRNLQRT